MQREIPFDKLRAGGATGGSGIKVGNMMDSCCESNLGGTIAGTLFPFLVAALFGRALRSATTPGSKKSRQH